jgi:hypothetical protein
MGNWMADANFDARVLCTRYAEFLMKKMEFNVFCPDPNIL